MNTSNVSITAAEVRIWPFPFLENKSDTVQELLICILIESYTRSCAFSGYLSYELNAPEGHYPK